MELFRMRISNMEKSEVLNLLQAELDVLMKVVLRLMKVLLYVMSLSVLTEELENRLFLEHGVASVHQCWFA